MFTTFVKTTFCSLVITALMAVNAHAQLSSVFGGNSGHGGRGGQSGQHSPQQPHRQQQQPAPAPVSSLVGQWYAAADVEGGRLEVLYVFNADSTMILAMAKTPQQGQPETARFNGRYQVNGDSIQIRYDDGDVENYRVVQVSSNQLTIASDSQTFTFDKIQPQKQQQPPQTGGHRQQPAPRTNPAPAQNPYAGTWLLNESGFGKSVDGRLSLNADGTFHLNLNLIEGSNTSQISGSGRWHVEGNFMVFNTNGDVERIPFQCDGKRIALDLTDENVRLVFGRNANDSYVEALN